MCPACTAHMEAGQLFCQGWLQSLADNLQAQVQTRYSAESYALAFLEAQSLQVLATCCQHQPALQPAAGHTGLT